MKKSLKRHEQLDSNPSADTFLKAGVAVADITPPLDVGLLMSSVRELWAPFQSVRLPLKARVLALEAGGERVALVALDLLALNSLTVGGWRKFKQAIARGLTPTVAADNIVLTCTHTHNAPESTSVTDLYKTRQFQQWLDELRAKLIGAINTANAAARACKLAFGSDELEGFSLQRRIPTEAGVIMSDSVQPIAPELFRRGPVDRRVRSLLLRGLDGTGIATVVHAICHPVHEMCQPHISADFPGELCVALESWGGGGVPLFFNGAAGDINPPTVSEGTAAARRHGRALAEVVKTAAGRAEVFNTRGLAFQSRTVDLPMRSMKGLPLRRTCSARLSALRLGSMAVVFLPGEIFVETALAIEQASPFEQTIIVGFAESSVGYVPTRKAFEEGGYEIGPGKWSFLQVGAESMIQKSAIELLEELKSRSAETKNGVRAMAGISKNRRKSARLEVV